jgi:FAD/FMN-containing dehydrogenase
MLGPEKVRSDARTLDEYATDEGIYRVTPAAVVRVREEEDVRRVIGFCRENGVPLTPRAGGTNLVGAAIGPGVILDFSEFDEVLEIDEGRRIARVRPGTLLADLNARLEGRGLMFPPDPGSMDSCRVGGMIGTNASGARTVKYGSTKDYLDELVVYLASGRRVVARRYALDDPELGRILEENPELARVRDLLEENADLLRSRRPRVTKNSSGYLLAEVADSLMEGRLDLPRLLAASEGTLAVTVEASLRLVPAPAARVTVRAYFESLDDAAEAVLRVLPLGPSKVEMLDSGLMDLMGREEYGMPPAAAATLLLEFDEGTLVDVASRVMEACEGLRLSSDPVASADPSQQKALWAARSEALPTLRLHHPRRQPWPVADDVVVPVEAVPATLSGLARLCLERGVAWGIFGHVGDGNFHFHPLVDLADPAEREAAFEIARESSRLAIGAGGSPSGEHGDGRLRQEFLEDLYGPEVVALMRAVKDLMDPRGILNPGVKIGSRPMDRDLDPAKVSRG